MHTDLTPIETPNAPVVAPTAKRKRRSHSREFKERLISLHKQGGQSLASIAQTHDINANLLHKWVRQCERSEDNGQLLPVSVMAPKSSGSSMTITLSTASISVNGSCDPALLSTAIKALS